MRAGRRAAALGLVWAAAMWPTIGRAQNAAEPRNFPAERFRLALDANGILDVESGAVPNHLSYELALWLGFADDPLVIDRRTGDDTTRQGELVGSRLGAELVFSIALFDWVQVGVNLPMVFYQDRQDSIPGVNNLGSLGQAGFGSPRVVPKLRLLRQSDHGIHLAVMPTFVAPSLQDEGYFGQDSWTFEPEIAASRRFGAVEAGANVGYRVRQKETFVDLEIDDEFFARVGAGLRLDRMGGPPLGIDLTLAGATSANSPLSRGNRDYGEILGGLRYAITRPLIAFAGGGVGINRGFGTPDWRAFAGMRWSAQSADADDDGIIDSYDACPEVPEDVDGFRDTDGCPDLDNDEDGIDDKDDGAPMRPEDKDNFEDTDGVPDPDNDGDRVMDWDDGCPNEAGPVDNRGCPDGDADGDKIVDRVDACPNDPEDIDGYEDTDGCPDRDDDLDGVADGSDDCPRKVGPPENRGCPDTDTDGDGVVDRKDNCPTEAGEVANQGCKTPQLVKITSDGTLPKLEILDKVHFKFNSEEIQRRSFGLLNNVAKVLKAHKEIDKVRIEGHTDSKGSRAYNLRLSDRRAKSVRRFLMGRGIAAKRLTAIGFGPDVPIASNETATGRAANRRVEFRIVYEETEVQ